ncbi:MAG: dihydroorotase [Gammaproteobacteria bacterium]|nr:dihydroorotase [Gammaproteobacteria bacterium]
MNTVLLKNARLIDPARGTDQAGDLFIKDGIFQSAENVASADQVIDASGLIACPGLVDLYARLREPGQEKKATIASETRAALHGGITTLVCSPDTDPVIDETATVEFIHRRVDDAGFARVEPLAALTQKLDGKQISELATLQNAGCIAASNADKPIDSPRVLRMIMEYAATFGIKLVMVAQDASLSAKGVMHEGLISTRMGLIGIPVAAETVALGMIMELAWQTGAQVHLSRLSSARGVDLVREAKSRGLSITADTSINHLFLTDQDLLGFNSLCHVIPPLRYINDRDSLREAIMDGTLDAICSDHAPHDPDAKLAPFPSTEPGISSLDIFLPLLVRLAEDSGIPLTKILSLATSGPASIMDLQAGSMIEGKRADLVLFDPQKEFICDTASFVSKGKNSPYGGYRLKGPVEHCFVGGRHFTF